MKVLHVITSLRFGGAEKLIVDIAPRLRAVGDEVEVLVFDGTRTPFLEQLEGLGVVVHSFGVGGSVYNPRHILGLRRYLRSFDIVHTHNTSAQYFAVLCRFLFGGRARLVTTEHSTSNRRRGSWLFRIVDRFVYRDYDSVICISDKTKTALEGYLRSALRSTRVLTIENGIDVEQYSAAQPMLKSKIFGLPDDSIVIAQVSGFRHEKDQDTLIRSMKYLPEDVCIVFAGSGERIDECRALAQSEGVESRVIFMGARTDVAAILKSADIVVQSSHWEGFGLAAVEGMATSKPVVVSNVPGLAEVVGVAGVLFEAGDADGLAGALSKLIEDKEYYDQVSTRCCERAKLYDISRMVEGYHCEYIQVMESIGDGRK